MNIQADKRAELDLQVNLLSEHEITKLITLVTAMAKKMGLEEAAEEGIDELKKDVHPEKVMDVLEKLTEDNKS